MERPWPSLTQHCWDSRLRFRRYLGSMKNKGIVNPVWWNRGGVTKTVGGSAAVLAFTVRDWELVGSKVARRGGWIVILEKKMAIPWWCGWTCPVIAPKLRVWTTYHENKINCSCAGRSCIENTSDYHGSFVSMPLLAQRKWTSTSLNYIDNAQRLNLSFEKPETKMLYRNRRTKKDNQTQSTVRNNSWTLPGGGGCFQDRHWYEMLRRVVVVMHDCQNSPVAHRFKTEPFLVDHHGSN